MGDTTIPLQLDEAETKAIAKGDYSKVEVTFLLDRIRAAIEEADEADPEYVVVRDSTKRMKIARKMLGGGLRIAMTCEPDTQAARVVSRLNRPECDCATKPALAAVKDAEVGHG